MTQDGPEIRKMLDRVDCIDEMFDTATGWGSWMAEASSERKNIINRLNRDHGYALPHKYELKPSLEPNPWIKSLEKSAALAEVRVAPGIDNTPRKAHYGDGEQPWDVIVRLGWGPAFAAGNVLKYLRRSKHPEHSLESAAWYYARLVEGCAQEPQMGASTRRYKFIPMKPWSAALHTLEDELTQAERARVRGYTTTGE